jgi:Ca-activated chloride channel family protein
LAFPSRCVHVRANKQAIAVITLPFLALVCLAGAGGPQVSEPFRISVDVNLVVLHPTVRDGKGQFASDLHAGDFEVYEDGVRQAIRLFQHEDVPVTVGLLVDHSSSMRHKLAEVTAAARSFVHSSSPEDQIFVVNFNERVTLGLPDTIGFTDNSAELERAVSRMPAEGMTALYDAVVVAQERLQAGTHDKKVLIVISDGGDNASTHSLAEVLKIAERSSALVYTIGIFDADDEDKNPDVLRRLARATGGEVFLPGKLDDVVAICERIARDLRHQYTLGYVSGNPAKPGVYRSIRVVARSAANGKLVVRTRSGYIAGKAEK